MRGQSMSRPALDQCEKDQGRDGDHDNSRYDHAVVEERRDRHFPHEESGSDGLFAGPSANDGTNSVFILSVDVSR